MSIVFMAILAASLVAPLDDTIVTPAWLAENLGNPGIVVVEIGTLPDDRPHIPGARFVAIDSIVSREGWPPDELPPVEQLRLAFENAGVGDEGRIILYSSNPLFATRAWFTLDYLGQGHRTAILDGGYTRWVEEHRPVATQRHRPLAASFSANPMRDRIVSLAETRAAIDAGAVLIDARSAMDFHGWHRGRQVTRRGHIPGASCAPWQTNMDGTSFRTESELKSAYEGFVGRKDAKVIVYCRTGMEASMPYFVLRSLGYDVALYDGSFTEWSRERTMPVQRLSRR